MVSTEVGTFVSSTLLLMNPALHQVPVQWSHRTMMVAVVHDCMAWHTHGGTVNTR